MRCVSSFGSTTAQTVTADRWRRHSLRIGSAAGAAAGMTRIDDQVDWENVAEEIVDVGRSELRAVASHLMQALLHDLKAEAWPLSRDAPHWRAEARGQRDDSAQ